MKVHVNYKAYLSLLFFVLCLPKYCNKDIHVGFICPFWRLLFTFVWSLRFKQPVWRRHRLRLPFYKNFKRFSHSHTQTHTCESFVQETKLVTARLFTTETWRSVTFLRRWTTSAVKFAETFSGILWWFLADTTFACAASRTNGIVTSWGTVSAGAPNVNMSFHPDLSWSRTQL